MKITIKKEKLSPVLSMMDSVIEKKPIYPILKNVLIEQVNENCCRVSVLKFGVEEVSFMAEVEAKADEGKGICLSLEALKDACKVAPKGSDVVIAGEGEKGSVTVEEQTVDVENFDANMFPYFKPAGEESGGKCMAGEWAEALKKTSVACAKQHAGKSLEGVLLEMKSGQLRCVASDGKKLVMTEIDCESSEEAHGVMPKESANDLIKVLNKNKKMQVSVKFGKSYCVIQGDTWEMRCKLIEAAYPDYRKALPKENPYAVHFQASDLKMALSEAEKLSGALDPSVAIVVESGRVSMKAYSKEWASEIALVADYDGPKIQLGLNIESMKAVLKVMREETIIMDIKDAVTNVMMHGINRDGRTICVAAPSTL